LLEKRVIAAYDSCIVNNEVPYAKLINSNVEKLKNGNYRLIVAIADVSYYVKKDSPLDLEARNRGNSVFTKGITRATVI